MSAKRNLRWTTAIFWAGGLLLIGASAYIYASRAIDEISAAAVLLGYMLMMGNFFDFIGIGKGGRDERARKIGTLSATWSWYITLCFAALVLVFSYWSGREFATAHLLSTVIFIMATSMLAINTYYSLRGDAE